MLKYVKNGPLLISYLKAKIIVLTPKSATPSSNLQNIHELKKMSAQLFRTPYFKAKSFWLHCITISVRASNLNVFSQITKTFKVFWPTFVFQTQISMLMPLNAFRRNFWLTEKYG